MTANAITTAANHTLDSIGKIIPSLPKLVDLGFTPKILLSFAVVGGTIYIIDKAIDAKYVVTGRYEANNECYEFALRPAVVEA